VISLAPPGIGPDQLWGLLDLLKPSPDDFKLLSLVGRFEIPDMFLVPAVLLIHFPMVKNFRLK
jgi:hypothetical protein